MFKMSSTGASTSCFWCKRDIHDNVYCQECFDQLDWSEILPGVYLSSYDKTLNYKKLQQLGIKQILTVEMETRHETPDFEVKYVRISDNPFVNIRKYFEECHEFIQKAPTIIHCFAGISRSATIVISFLMKVHKMSLKKALNFCQEKRPCVDPNPGFIMQLIEYEKELTK